MDRLQADTLVRRAERQNGSFLKSILVGYALGFVVLLVVLGAEGELTRPPASLQEFLELLGVLFVVPVFFFGLVFAAVFKIRHHRSAEWKFDHAISIETDVDMKVFDLLDAIDRIAEGDIMSQSEAELVRDVLRGELAKAQQSGADPVCLAAYLRMRLEDHRHDSDLMISDDHCLLMIELIDERDPG
tara:strand:+ start:211 stop:771 length:561 start_codon:yes stop_codon:yes gene_type:complete